MTEEGEGEDFLNFIKYGFASMSVDTLEMCCRNVCDVDQELRMRFVGAISKLGYEVVWWEAIGCCFPPAGDRSEVRCFTKRDPERAGCFYLPKKDLAQVAVNFLQPGAKTKVQSAGGKTSVVQAAAPAEPEPKPKAKTKPKSNAENQALAKANALEKFLETKEGAENEVTK